MLLVQAPHILFRHWHFPPITLHACVATFFLDTRLLVMVTAGAAVRAAVVTAVGAAVGATVGMDWVQLLVLQ